MVETLAVARLRTANLPVRFQKIMNDQALIDATLDSAEPDGRVRSYAAKFREGKVLRASDWPLTCGVGLWCHGSGPEPDLTAAVMVQNFVLTGAAETAYFVNVDDLIELESPDGEGLGDRRWVDVLVIQGLGEHHRSASGWSDTLIYGLLRRRFDRGLPTIVTSPVAASASGLPAHFVKQAFTLVAWRDDKE